MTGADASADPGARPGPRWDVALSFAGAQREYVGQVAAALKARGVRCFYDADRQVRLWGTNLAEELPRIYERESVVVVVFVSADYAEGDWTRLERRAAFSRAVREAGVYVLPARFDDSELPGLLGDVVAINLRCYTPGQFADLVVAKLADLGTSPPPSPGEADSRPPGGVRVSEADPRRLGVHAAISVPGVTNETLPEYVPRDADAGIRATILASAQRGGFVLLVGGSSVGKTRCAFESVRALLPEWWLVHPAGPDQVATLAQAPPSQTVVWLDELQRYLDGEHGLTGGVTRALLNAPDPVVIIGTLWPDRYAAYTALPAPGGADPHAREREVLDLAEVVRIAPEFSAPEQDRARAAAVRDRRLRVALKAAGYGLTQTLAAAPQLVARWEDAKTAAPYAWAVLTAALDIARLGARAPLTADLLHAAVPGYCTSQQQARAPGNWFEQALAYATEELHGAAAPLSPTGSRIGQIDGYTAADYLIQYASRERHSARVPASTWDAMLSHIRDPADASRLADSAENRLLYRYAIPLYRHAADTGDERAAFRLADRLARRGDLDGLRTRADAGDRDAALRLAHLLEERGDFDGAAQILRTMADAGDSAAAFRLVDLLARRGDLDGLRARADAGDERAAFWLADRLARRGDLNGLRTRADAGDSAAILWLADLREERGDMDGAVQILRTRADADADDWQAARQLADRLADRGDLDELRTRADAGDSAAAFRLAGLLEERGDFDGAEQILRTVADAGDSAAAFQLEEERRYMDGSVHLLSTGSDASGYAAFRLASLLARRGDLDGAAQILIARHVAGDREAANRLAELLADHGDLDGAAQFLRAWADAGNVYAALQWAELLARRGDLDELRTRADAGDNAAARQLAGRLADRGDLDELRTRADAGDSAAANRLAGLLKERGDLDGAEQILRTVADAGDAEAAVRLADLLAGRGNLDGLRTQADAGDGVAARRLAEELSKQQGRGEEAERLRRFGLNPDGSIARA